VIEKELVTSAAAAPAGGPYSPALKIRDYLFLSGQGGFDPASGALAGDTIEEQTEQTFRNISALLEAGGHDLGDVVSCQVHLSDLSVFDRFNAVYERHFDEPRPVRTTVGASLLRGMLVEITVVSYRCGDDHAGH
jgi:reactive intermediate/imine deaminase